MTPQTFKHFKIMQLLGKGGMGEVYLALDTTLERKVALKFLPRDLLRDPSAQGRLLDEARSASRVQHPNIATVHSIEEDGGIYALCMEYVDGATLKQLVKRGPLSLNQIARVGADIASGMQAAHEQGMVHRDLKPANVMISRRGEVKVMDFGLAIRPQRVVNTLGPNTYGTVQYMSPEQAQGLKLGPASDIFSLGSLLFELITGRPPFKASNDLAILQAIINTQPEALRDLRRDVPPALEQIVRGCLAKSPDQRWASMSDIRDELQYVEPTVEAGPRDLISELSSGLADQSGTLHHRPDNAGRVGRRTSTGTAANSAPPSDLVSIQPDLPPGFVVHDVVQPTSKPARPTPPRPAPKATDSRGPSGNAPSESGAPVGMVLGPEVDLDGSGSGGGLAFRSTSQQWQDRARGDATALSGSSGTRSAEIAREAARRARDSRPVTPVPVIEEPAGERVVRDLQDLSSISARRLRTRVHRTSPLTVIGPALVALLIVGVAGYALLARVGAVPPLKELIQPSIEAGLPNEATEDAAAEPSVEESAPTQSSVIESAPSALRAVESVQQAAAARESTLVDAVADAEAVDDQR